MGAEPFPNFREGMVGPVTRSVAVTPNDNTDLPEVPRALFVGGAGSLSVILQKDSAALSWSNVPAGSVLPIRPKRIRQTGTTAGNIIALY